MSSGQGKLSIVATPIGNLEDITLRALRTLREADIILAEDTRHTRKLCTHHGIQTPLQAYHAHTSPAATDAVLARLAAGAHMALVSDAGTPVLSDPGAELIAAAADQGTQIEAIPGASAVTAAVTLSGLTQGTFSFVGFLPRAGKHRNEALERIERSPEPTVFFEAPPRLQGTLRDLGRVLSAHRRIAVCREITKLHEEVVRGNVAEVTAHFEAGVRGEITVVVEGRDENDNAKAEEAVLDIDAEIQKRLQAGERARDIARALALLSGKARREIYARVLAAQARTADEPQSRA